MFAVAPASPKAGEGGATVQDPSKVPVGSGTMSSPVTSPKAADGKQQGGTFQVGGKEDEGDGGRGQATDAGGGKREGKEGAGANGKASTGGKVYGKTEVDLRRESFTASGGQSTEQFQRRSPLDPSPSGVQGPQGSHSRLRLVQGEPLGAYGSSMSTIHGEAGGDGGGEMERLGGGATGEGGLYDGGGDGDGEEGYDDGDFYAQLMRAEEGGASGSGGVEEEGSALTPMQRQELFQDQLQGTRHVNLYGGVREKEGKEGKSEGGRGGGRRQPRKGGASATPSAPSAPSGLTSSTAGGEGGEGGASVAVLPPPPAAGDMKGGQKSDYRRTLALRVLGKQRTLVPATVVKNTPIGKGIRPLKAPWSKPRPLPPPPPSPPLTPREGEEGWKDGRKEGSPGSVMTDDDEGIGGSGGGAGGSEVGSLPGKKTRRIRRKRTKSGMKSGHDRAGGDPDRMQQQLDKLWGDLEMPMVGRLEFLDK